jgi:hypothetical protein
VNREPTLVLPSQPNNVRVLVADVETLTIVAIDADGDTVAMYWTIPNGMDSEVPEATWSEETVGDQVTYTSTQQVPRDARLDGAVIEAEVTDFIDPITVRWAVSLEE